MMPNRSGVELPDLAWQGNPCAGGPVPVAEGDRQ